MSLTETKVRAIAPTNKPQLIGDGNSLYLKVATSGRKTWIHRTRRQGKWAVTLLGVHPAVTLAEARARAAMLSATPTQDSVSVSDLADEYFRRVVQPTWKETRMAEGYSRRLKGAFGRRSLKSVTTSELVDNLVAYAKDSPVAANRCLSYWKLVFQYANQRGWAASSPLASTTSKAIGGPEKSRDRVLTNAEIQWVFQWDHRHAKLLRFLLLTGLRISEAQAATAEQIEGDILNIPDNKSSRPHFVFLTPLAKDQIDTTDPTGRLFPPCSSTSVQSALRATGATFTPHDLRRTFATRAAGLTQPHIVEKLLNHSLPGVMAVYNRNDYREERITATISVSDLIQGLLESKV